MKRILLYIVLILGLSSILFAMNSRFIRDDANAVVLDTATNLLWQDDDAVADDTTSYTWGDAIGYCEDLNISGFEDWYLPNINELQTIVDFGSYNAANYEDFWKIINGYYWTSTTSFDPNRALYINFYNGQDGNAPKTSTYYVRCVRKVDN